MGRIATGADPGHGAATGAEPPAVVAGIDSDSDRAAAAAISRGDSTGCRSTAAASSRLSIGTAAATVSGIAGTGGSTPA